MGRKELLQLFFKSVILNIFFYNEFSSNFIIKNKYFLIKMEGISGLKIYLGGKSISNFFFFLNNNTEIIHLYYMFFPYLSHYKSPDYVFQLWGCRRLLLPHFLRGSSIPNLLI
jgi:hypothetical protein